MNKRGIQKSIGVLVLLLMVYGVYYVYNKENTEFNNSSDNLDKIRIGWQTQWATQGQVVQALKETSILKNNNLEAKFVPGDYGPQLNEYAIAGEVDVILTADQPATVLISKLPDDWIIVGRLMYNRVGIYVPVKSNITSVADLKDKKIGLPFGAAAQRDAYKVLLENGININDDVEIRNVGMAEQSTLINFLENGKWGNSTKNYDAFSGFDPLPAHFEAEDKAKMLHVGKIVSVVVMSKDYLEEKPEVVKSFLKSFIQAWHYYANNQSETNQWFIKDSKLNFSEKALDIAASIEPNIKAKEIGDIQVGFEGNDISIMQEASQFLFDKGIISQKINILKHIDLSIIEKAKFELVSESN